MKTTCGLCFRHCVLEEGQTGFCRARQNKGGKIISLSYGKITALALDPIEKKPLMRFRPGTLILSAGSFGCNLRCPFCQNHDISMSGLHDTPAAELSPTALVQKADRLKAAGNIGLAYTYNEPIVNYEYVRDCAVLIRKRGMANILVTNGTIEEKPWKELLPLIDAANIDLKAFTEEGYRRVGGDLATVKRSIALAAEACHVEVTTLVVPGENDNEEEIRALAAWLSGLDRDIPLHVSRFFPRYRMTGRSPTPVRTIYRLAGAAGEYLKHVYTGNC